MLHNLAHIELNAVDLAWDTLVRFAPLALHEAFYADFARVADDEARHFGAWLGGRGGATGKLHCSLFVRTGQGVSVCVLPAGGCVAYHGCLEQHLRMRWLDGLRSTAFRFLTNCVLDAVCDGPFACPSFLTCRFCLLCVSMCAGWCAQRMAELGHGYGAMDAHDLLWEGAQMSSGALHSRLCVVPMSQARAGDASYVSCKRVFPHAVRSCECTLICSPAAIDGLTPALAASCLAHGMNNVFRPISPHQYLFCSLLPYVNRAFKLFLCIATEC